MSWMNEIITTLKAPKNQYNSFGKYNYRSCEDILEAVKPILNGAVLNLSDDIVNVGQFNYVKAVVTITKDGETFTATGMAREAVTKKGMDDSQITGAASSYARKYALNGLFCIDDTKDADTKDNRNNDSERDTKAKGFYEQSLKELDGIDEAERSDWAASKEKQLVWLGQHYPEYHSDIMAKVRGE